MFSARQWKEAATFVKQSPLDTIRNQQTLQRFIDAGETIQLGEKPPVLIYLATMLENEGSLQNEAESLEFVIQFVRQKKVSAIEIYVENNKLFECEALADLLLQYGLEKLAFKMYNKLKCHKKCILYLLLQNNIDGITKYLERFSDYQPNWVSIIQDVLNQYSDPSLINKLREFANEIIQKFNHETQFDEICEIVNEFMHFGHLKEATFLLLEVCKRLEFSEKSGRYQTLVFEINLENNPQFAEALFQRNKLVHFDRRIIYRKCEDEKARLYQRAFEFADNDDECIRIAIQYGRQERRPIFQSPDWYAEYCRSCGRFDEQHYDGDVQACVTALFNFQQALLDVVVDGAHIYAPHVAAAFAKLPIITSSPELTSQTAEMFKAFELDTNLLFFVQQSLVVPSLNEQVQNHQDQIDEQKTAGLDPRSMFSIGSSVQSQSNNDQPQKTCVNNQDKNEHSVVGAKDEVAKQANDHAEQNNKNNRNPITLQTIANVKEKQIVIEQLLKSKLFSISSELGFCAMDVSAEQHLLRIVNLKNLEMDSVLPMRAEAAIMAPNDAQIIVLRVPQALQAMSLATKTCLGRHNFEIPQTFDYWTWIDNDRLAIICPDAVYSWEYKSDRYLKIMTRDPALIQGLNATEINGFCISPDGDYALLSAIGLDPNTNTIQGNIQFYCFSKEASRIIPGHTGTLAQYKEDSTHPACTILTFASKAAKSSEIDMYMVECAPQKDQYGNPLSGFVRRQLKIPLNSENILKDFPFYMRSSLRFGFTYLVSKLGMLYVHDIGSGELIYNVQVSQNGVLATCSAQSGEIVLTSCDGTISELKIDENQIVDYIMNQLEKPDLALKLAMRANLRGPNKLYTDQFEKLFSARQWKEAAIFVKQSPLDTIRNQQTLHRFIDAGETVQLGEKPPVLIYLATMLENEGSLQNEAESLEFVIQFVRQKKVSAIEIYVENNKLFECEALADLLLQHGLDKLSFNMYNKLKCHKKIVFYFLQQNNLGEITKYLERFPDYQASWVSIVLDGLNLASRENSASSIIENLKELANDNIQKLDPEKQVDEVIEIVNEFNYFGYTREATFLLLEVCKRLEFLEKSGPYQTLVFAINLENNPQFAEALFQKNKLIHFDRKIIYRKCEDEKARLYQRAFEFADNDDACIRIAIQYGRQERKPIFESPDWYAEYCRSCGRFDEQHYDGDVQACVNALFNFQQALLDVVVDGAHIYAPHVAAAFARLPIITSSPELISYAAEMLKGNHINKFESKWEW